jgi:hypothetical protein
MKLKKFFRLLIKFTLLDELVGFTYWALALYGLYLIGNNISGSIFLVVSLFIYIVLITIVYIIFLKKLKSYFKDVKQ